jgi:hypothetical protein
MEVRIEAHNESAQPTALDARPDRVGVQVPIPLRIRLAVAGWFHGQSVVPFGARPYAPALVWLVAMGGASALGAHDPRAALVIAALGVIAAVATLRGPLGARTVTALAMIPGAMPSAPAWVWVLSGGAVALLVSARGGPVELRSHDLQRHLDWCRRRQENAHVLVLRFSLRDVPKPVRLLDSFRTTDSIALHYSHGTCELQAVLDDAGFSREGVERRVAATSDGAFRFGWAHFPDNGVTLDTLIETARADLLDPRMELNFTELSAESYA